jgi:hypothetical protein
MLAGPTSALDWLFCAGPTPRSIAHQLAVGLGETFHKVVEDTEVQFYASDRATDGGVAEATLALDVLNHRMRL